MTSIMKLLLSSVVCVMMGVPAAAEAPDYRTPQKTMETFIRAMRANDTAAVRDCLTASDDNKSGILDAITMTWIGPRRLLAAVSARFGGKASEDDFGAVLSERDLDQMARDLPGVKAEITGETARLTSADAGDPMRGLAEFRKTRDGWKLDVNALGGIDDPAAAMADKGSWLFIMVGTSRTADAVATRVRSGDFKSVDEVKAAAEELMKPLTAEYEAAQHDRPLPATTHAVRKK